jgi:CheY-like chemotaxis protein
LTRSLLGKLHHRPTLTTDGAETVASFLAAHAAGSPYDVILMDVRMAGLDGLEATRRIRSAEAANGWRRTPIVALTANALPEHRDACLGAGMDGFVTKPLDRERLEAALADYVRRPQIAA